MPRPSYNPSACDRPGDLMPSHDPPDNTPGLGPGHSTIAHRVHDLKNLLTIMAGCVDTLAPQLTETRSLADLADLQRALSRAFLLATDLLGSDAALLNERPAIDINHAIGDVEGLLRRMLGPVGLTLRLAAKAPFVYAHPLDIERILFNLVLNARDAMGDKGGMTIETVLMMDEAQGGGAARSRRVVRLIVSDTGPGIAPGVRTTWPEPFVTTRLRGRGFGLSSVSETVQRLEGRLHIDSQQAIGTRIVIDIPLAG